MNFIKTLLSLFDSTDFKLIRGGGMTAIIMYLVHYIFEADGNALCFNKVAAAFTILVLYFIIEPVVRANRRR